MASQAGNDKMAKDIRENLRKVANTSGRYFTGSAKLFLASTRDLAKNSIPTVGAMFETNAELIENVTSVITNPSGTIAKAADKITGSGTYQNLMKLAGYALEDLKSGNFYDPDRDRTEFGQDTAALLDNFGDFDMDQFDENGDFKMDDEIDMKEFERQVALQENSEKASDARTSATIDTVQKVGMAVVHSNNANAQTDIRLGIKQHAQMMAGMENLITQSGAILQAVNQTATSMLEVTRQAHQEVMAQLTSITDLLTTISMNTQKPTGEVSVPEESDELYGVYGELDVKKWLTRAAKQTADKYQISSMLGMVTGMDYNTLLESMMSNPLQLVSDFAVKKMIPTYLNKTIETTSQYMENFFPTLMAKFADRGKRFDRALEAGQEGKLSDMLLGMLGVQERKGGYLDLRPKDITEAAGLTKKTVKAIEEVIPMWLSKIYSAVSGDSLSMYDYSNGTMVDVYSKIASTKREAEDLVSRMGEASREFMSRATNDEIFKWEDKKMQEDFKNYVYRYLQKAASDGNFINPWKNAVDFDAELPESEYKNLYGKIIKSVALNMPRNQLMGLNSEINYARTNQRRANRQTEKNLQESGLTTVFEMAPADLRRNIESKAMRNRTNLSESEREAIVTDYQKKVRASGKKLGMAATNAYLEDIVSLLKRGLVVYPHTGNNNYIGYNGPKINGEAMTQALGDAQAEGDRILRLRNEEKRQQQNELERIRKANENSRKEQIGENRGDRVWINKDTDMTSLGLAQSKYIAKHTGNFESDSASVEEQRYAQMSEEEQKKYREQQLAFKRQNMIKSHLEKRAATFKQKVNINGLGPGTEDAGPGFIDRINSITETPFKMVDLGLRAIDQFMFKMLYGEDGAYIPGDDLDREAHSLMQTVTTTVQAQWAQAKSWFATNIGEPLREFFLGEEGLLPRISQRLKDLYDTQLKPRVDKFKANASNKLIGTKGDDGQYSGGIFSRSINKAGGLKGGFLRVASTSTRNFKNRFLYGSDDETSDNLKYRGRMTRTVDDMDGLMRKRYNHKTGKMEYTYRNADGTKETLDHLRTKLAIEYSGFMGTLKKGFDNFKDMMFGPDASGNDHDSKKKFNLVSGELKKAFPDMTIGAGVGLIGSFFLPGGPILGMLLGSFGGIVTGSERFRDFLFGKPKKKTRQKYNMKTGLMESVEYDSYDDTGIFSSQVIDGVKQYFPKMAGGAVLGRMIGGGIMPGIMGQAIGTVAGSIVGMVASSDRLKQIIFGDASKGDDDGIISKRMRDGIARMFQEHAPGVIVGGLTGAKVGSMIGAGIGLIPGLAIMGPISTIMGSIVGALGGDTLQGFFFGKSQEVEVPDPNNPGKTIKTTRRVGGLFGQAFDYTRDHIFKPFGEHVNKLGVAVSNWFNEDVVGPLSRSMKPVHDAMERAGNAVRETFLNIGQHIKDSLDRTFNSAFGQSLHDFFEERVMGPLKKMTNAIFSGIGKAIGAVLSAPFKAVEYIFTGHIGGEIPESQRQKKSSRIDRMKTQVGETARDLKMKAQNARYSHRTLSEWKDDHDAKVRAKKIARDAEKDRRAREREDRISGFHPLQSISTKRREIEDRLHSRKVAMTAEREAKKDERRRRQEERDHLRNESRDRAKTSREKSDDTPRARRMRTSEVKMPKAPRERGEPSPKFRGSEGSGNIQYRNASQTNDVRVARGKSEIDLLSNISRKVSLIYDEIRGQLGNTGWNLGYIKVLLEKKLGKLKAKNLPEEMEGSTRRSVTKRRGLLGRMVHGVGSAVGGVANAGGNLLKGAFSLVTAPLKILGGAISGLGKAVGTATKGILSATGTLIKGVTKGVASLFSAGVKVVGNVLGGAAKIIGGAAAGIGRALGNVVGTLTGVLKDLTLAVSGVVSGLVRTVAQIVPDLAKGIWNGIKTVGTVVGKAAWNGIKFVGKGIGWTVGKIADGIGSLFGGSGGSGGFGFGNKLIPVGVGGVEKNRPFPYVEVINGKLMYWDSIRAIPVYVVGSDANGINTPENQQNTGDKSKDGEYTVADLKKPAENATKMVTGRATLTGAYGTELSKTLAEEKKEKKVETKADDKVVRTEEKKAAKETSMRTATGSGGQVQTGGKSVAQLASKMKFINGGLSVHINGMNLEILKLLTGREDLQMGVRMTMKEKLMRLKDPKYWINKALNRSYTTLATGQTVNTKRLANQNNQANPNDPNAPNQATPMVAPLNVNIPRQGYVEDAAKVVVVGMDRLIAQVLRKDIDVPKDKYLVNGMGSFTRPGKKNAKSDKKKQGFLESVRSDLLAGANPLESFFINLAFDKGEEIIGKVKDRFINGNPDKDKAQEGGKQDQSSGGGKSATEGKKKPATGQNTPGGAHKPAPGAPKAVGTPKPGSNTPKAGGKKPSDKPADGEQSKDASDKKKAEAKPKPAPGRPKVNKNASVGQNVLDQINPLNRRLDHIGKMPNWKLNLTPKENVQAAGTYLKDRAVDAGTGYVYRVAGDVGDQAYQRINAGINKVAEPVLEGAEKLHDKVVEGAGKAMDAGIDAAGRGIKKAKDVVVQHTPKQGKRVAKKVPLRPGLKFSFVVGGGKHLKKKGETETAEQATAEEATPTAETTVASTVPTPTEGPVLTVSPDTSAADMDQLLKNAAALNAIAQAGAAVGEQTPDMDSINQELLGKLGGVQGKMPTAEDTIGDAKEGSDSTKGIGLQFFGGKPSTPALRTPGTKELTADDIRARIAARRAEAAAENAEDEEYVDTPEADVPMEDPEFDFSLHGIRGAFRGMRHDVRNAFRGWRRKRKAIKRQKRQAKWDRRIGKVKGVFNKVGDFFGISSPKDEATPDVIGETEEAKPKNFFQKLFGGKTFKFNLPIITGGFHLPWGRKVKDAFPVVIVSNNQKKKKDTEGNTAEKPTGLGDKIQDSVAAARKKLATWKQGFFKRGEKAEDASNPEEAYNRAIKNASSQEEVEGILASRNAPAATVAAEATKKKGLLDTIMNLLPFLGVAKAFISKQIEKLKGGLLGVVLKLFGDDSKIGQLASMLLGNKDEGGGLINTIRTLMGGKDSKGGVAADVAETVAEQVLDKDGDGSLDVGDAVGMASGAKGLFSTVKSKIGDSKLGKKIAGSKLGTKVADMAKSVKSSGIGASLGKLGKAAKSGLGKVGSKLKSGGKKAAIAAAVIGATAFVASKIKKAKKRKLEEISQNELPDETAEELGIEPGTDMVAATEGMSQEEQQSIAAELNAKAEKDKNPKRSLHIKRLAGLVARGAIIGAVTGKSKLQYVDSNGNPVDTTFGDQVKSFISDSRDGIRSGVSKVSEALVDMGDGDKLKGLSQADGALGTVGKGLVKLRDLGSGLINKAKGTKVVSAASDAIGPIKKAIQGVIEKFMNNSTVKTMFGSLAGKISSLTTKLVNFINGKVLNKAMKEGGEAAAKSAGKGLAGILSGGILTAAFAVADFISGFSNVGKYFGVYGSNASLGMKLTSGIVNALGGLVGSIPIVGGVITIALAIFQNEIVQMIYDFLADDAAKAELAANQAQVQADVNAYNQANGTDLSVEDYVSKFNADGTRKRSVFGKVKGFFTGNKETGERNIFGKLLHFGEGITFLGNKQTSLAQMGDKVGEFFKERFANITGAIDEYKDKTKDMNTAQKIGTGIGMVVNKVNEQIGSLMNNVGQLTGTIVGKFSNMFNYVKDTVSGIADTVKAIPGKVVDWFQNLPKNASHWWEDITTKFKKGIKDVQLYILSIPVRIRNWVVEKFTALGKWFQALPGKIMSWVGEKLGPLGKFFTDLTGAATDEMDAAKSYNEGLSNVKGDEGGFLGGYKSAKESVTTDYQQPGIRTVADNWQADISKREGTFGAGPGLPTDANSMEDIGRGIGKEMVQSTLNTMRGNNKSFAEVFNKMGRGMGGTMIDDLKDSGHGDTNMSTVITDSLEKIFNKIFLGEENTNAAKTKQKSFYESLKTGVSNVFSNIKEGLGNAMDSAVTWIQDAGGKVADWLGWNRDESGNAKPSETPTETAAASTAETKVVDTVNTPPATPKIQVDDGQVKAAANLAASLRTTHSANADTMKRLADIEAAYNGSAKTNADKKKYVDDISALFQSVHPAGKGRWGTGVKAMDQTSSKYNKGSDMMAKVGCGPTAAAMVASAYGNKSANPIEANQKSIQSGMRASDGGTNPDFFNQYASNKNFGMVKGSADPNAISKNLNRGQPVVMMGKGGSYGNNMHYMVAEKMSGKNQVGVVDPIGGARKNISMQDLTKNASQAVYSYGKGPDDFQMQQLYNQQMHDTAHQDAMRAAEMANQAAMMATPGVFGMGPVDMAAENEQAMKEEQAKKTFNAQKAVVDQMAWLAQPGNKIKYSTKKVQDPDQGWGSCASTVGWAYRKALGVEGMSASSTTQSTDDRFETIWTNDGSGLPADAKFLRPGDVMYYHWNKTKNNGKMTHTEMYAGNNQDLNHGGPNEGDLGPEYRDLNDYRRSHLMMVRRYKPFLTGEEVNISDGTRTGNFGSTSSGSFGYSSNTNTTTHSETGSSGSSIFSWFSDWLGGLGSKLSNLLNMLLGEGSAEDNTGETAAAARDSEPGSTTSTSTTITPTTAATTVGDLKGLGSISAQYESNGNPATVSGGEGDHGGRSFGTYQFPSYGNEYVSDDSNLARFWNKYYGPKHPGVRPGANQKFIDTWQAEAYDNPEQFQANEHQFMVDNYYANMVASNMSVMDPNQHSRAAQEIWWSTGTQYGSNTKILKNALADKNPTQMSAEELINTVQDYKVSSVDKYFPKCSASVRRGVANRHDNGERNSLLAIKDEPPISPEGQEMEPAQTTPGTVTAIEEVKVPHNLRNVEDQTDYVSAMGPGYKPGEEPDWGTGPVNVGSEGISHSVQSLNNTVSEINRLMQKTSEQAKEESSIATMTKEITGAITGTSGGTSDKVLAAVSQSLAQVVELLTKIEKNTQQTPQDVNTGRSSAHGKPLQHVPNGQYRAQNGETEPKNVGAAIIDKLTANIR